MSCGCSTGTSLPKAIRRDWLEDLTTRTKLKEHEVKALYARFRKLAPNGFLQPEKFRQTLGVLGLSDDTFLPDRMFHVFNLSGNGKLTFQEFANALAVMIRGSEDEKLKLSFEMAAGHRNADGVSLKDFQRLILACDRMMQSLVAPTSSLMSIEDADRLFLSITGCEPGAEEDTVMSLESYKAAAQSSEEFLRAIGLVWHTSARPRGFSTDSAARTRLNLADSLWPSVEQSPEQPSRSPSSSPTRVLAAPTSATEARTTEEVFVSTRDLEELRARLSRVDELLQKKAKLQKSRSHALEDTQVLTSDEFPLQRPASPPAALAIAPTDDAWQDLCKLIDGWGVCGSRAGLQGSSMKKQSQPPDCNGLLGLSPLGDTTCDGFGLAPTHRRNDDFRMLSRDSSRPHSIGTSRSREPGEALEHMPVRQTDTMQANHRSNHRGRRHRLLGPKKGLAVHFGHESWNMVLSMMIGIRMSVARCKQEFKRELQPADFIMEEKFTITPRITSVPYSDDKKTITRFVDFAPLVFAKIRKTFGIIEDDYLHSVGPEQLLGNLVLGNLSSLSELSSEGKSGAFFYYTADGNYMMKTVTTKEFEVLRNMLKQYYDHITQNKDTFVVRFLGLHCLRVQRGQRSRIWPNERKELYFVVMANMFNTPCEIHRRYDLKGSWVGRVTPKDKRSDHVALKDVDFLQASEKIEVGSERRKQIIEQIQRDSEFLAKNNIIDYSLLLGIHVKDLSLNPSSMTLPGSPTAVAAPTGKTAGVASADGKSVYFMGIIDILTPYDRMKKMEHSLKAIRYDGRGVSCSPPPFYAERFCEFMQDKAFA
eukprot:TRINITY_DN33497_c0_g1_i1.p1 TRINITY_DN33497_c0_g1~~TRINITY_DN33497_c0_g1_i1.p1  ORF type:complete len:819 (-),score=162.72 TRINITY_DN33497_c0_g1_i1:30-2486(-)